MSGTPPCSRENARRSLSSSLAHWSMSRHACFASDEHLVSMPDGTVVRARSVQAFPVEQLWSKEAVDRVKGMPWAPTGTLTQNTYLRPSLPAPAEGADDERHWIPRGPPVRPRHLEKFGFFSNCRKCVHIRTGDGSQPALGHSQTCRKRIFAEVAKDPDMRCEVEAHERRKMKYLEAAVEQEDQRMKDSEEIPQPQSAPTQDATIASSSSSSSSSSASSSSSSQAGDDVPVAMSATASTDRDSVSKKKRGEESDDEEDQARPAAFRTLPPADTGPALALQETQLRHTHDVCEVFMPPRVAHRARERKLVGGWSLDEHVVDPVTNRTWDYVKGKDVQEVMNMIRKHRPRLLVVSPPCRSFSLLDSLEGQHSPRLQKTLKMAVAAIKFITLQKQLGGSFMLEHPVSSRLWKLPPVTDLVQEEVVHQIDFHMCAHGMRSSDSQGDGFASRPTRMLTNSSALAAHLDRRCVGGHRHVHADAGSSEPASHPNTSSRLIRTPS